MNAPVLSDRPFPRSAAPPPARPDPARLARFVADLRDRGFAGEIGGDPASRLVSATDNSLYQMLPALVLFPRTGRDLNLILRLASDPAAPVAVTARGGGTGTNGQSLTEGVVVDTSRHLNRVLALDMANREVTVEPGVVLDQLNQYLRPHGLFFPPAVSTATRATLGGMLATDASGKGSRVYGKTSDYVAAMDVVLADGTDFRVEPLAPAWLESLCAEDTIAGRACAAVRRVVTEHAAEIERVFPRMNRGLTGYNLQRAFDDAGRFTLHRVLAGSEGTLALTKAITFRALPIPKRRALAVVRYESIASALAHVGALLEADPLAVEFLDEKVIALARQDVVWAGLGRVLGGGGEARVGGMNFVEFVGESDTAMETQFAAFEAVMARSEGQGLVDWKLVREPAVIDQLWTLREKSVGLLGRVPGRKQGMAFVEDAAVPPAALPAFVADFRALLDAHGLAYGMYGHADVGCLHVRPLLDMQDPTDAALVRPISDEVASLARRYGGLLWGEHGRGFRGEYSPLFFGPVLYPELCRIKAAFDPLNILNPGKLATVPGPAGVPVRAIDAVPLRGAFDATVAPARAAGFEKAMACNGNGVCFSWDATDTMCPSYKATRDRAQSPKGRATLLREWARQQSLADADPGARANLAEIEAATHASLSTCLACKACVSQCPVQVDIPAMKARFLDTYHQARPRPLRDHLVAWLERLLPLVALWPRLANALAASRPGRWLLAAVSLVDLPAFSPRFFRGKNLDLPALAALPPAEKARAVILVPDTFTSAFDAAVPRAAVALLRRLGYAVHVAPWHANGKALHVLGSLDRFAPLARRAQATLTRYAATGVPLVGVETVTTLLERQEYRAPGDTAPPRVRTLDEFLAAELEAGRLTPHLAPTAAHTPPFGLFLHCTEKTALPQAPARWQAVFAAFGLRAEPVRTGCCGMSGLFGHEREHAGMSARLFDLSWREPLAARDPATAVATGFSCRCQAKRLTDARLRHPVEVLLETLEPPAASPRSDATGP